MVVPTIDALWLGAAGDTVRENIDSLLRCEVGFVEAAIVVKVES